MSQVFDLLSNALNVNKKYVTINSLISYALLIYLVYINSSYLLGQSVQCSSTSQSNLSTSFIENYCMVNTMNSMKSNTEFKFIDTHIWLTFHLIFKSVLNIITVLVINKYYNDLDKELMLDVEVTMFEKARRKFKAEHIADYLLKRVKITRSSKPYLIALLLDILNLFISFAQLVVLNKEINDLYEIDYLNYYKIPNIFPTLSICRINRNESTIETTSVQCSLSQNVINQKFYSFLWYWFQFLILFNLLKICFQLIISYSKYAHSLRRTLIWREIEDERMLIDVLDSTTVGGWIVLKHISSRSDNDLFEMIIMIIYSRLYKSGIHALNSAANSQSIEISSLVGERSKRLETSLIDEASNEKRDKRSKSIDALDVLEREDIENGIIIPSSLN